MLTWIPILNAWRLRRASTGGSDSPRYCYSVWLRHLITLDLYGFRVKGAQIGELGPGDSLGVGLAAMLSGASRYVGLDVVPFSAKADLEYIFDELTDMYSKREAIPDQNEFPNVWPRMDSYDYPDRLIDRTHLGARAERIRRELSTGMNSGPMVKYLAPWTSVEDVAMGSLDLIVSQAVLEHVENLEETYQAIYRWLKPGGYASHVIGFVSHHLAPTWNGHWAYSDLEWRLVRGCREFLINREPLSTHLRYATEVGFEVLLVKREYGSSGLELTALSRRFQTLDPEDARTSSVLLILRKR